MENRTRSIEHRCRQLSLALDPASCSVQRRDGPENDLTSEPHARLLDGFGAPSACSWTHGHPSFHPPSNVRLGDEKANFRQPVDFRSSADVRRTVTLLKFFQASTTFKILLHSAVRRAPPPHFVSLGCWGGKHENRTEGGFPRSGCGEVRIRTAVTVEGLRCDRTGKPVPPPPPGDDARRTLPPARHPAGPHPIPPRGPGQGSDRFPLPRSRPWRARRPLHLRS